MSNVQEKTMPAAGKGVLNQPISETPVAIFDFETTGLNAGPDRVVEVSVVRVDPGGEPKLVLDTLVNPRRKMAATEIHGITDADVRDAPRFEEIAGDLLRATYGCVLASYNIYFDICFLEYELSQVGMKKMAPHLCLMYMRPLLGLGCRCSLENACADHGLSYQNGHQAAHDALLSAQLWSVYQKAFQKRGVEIFGDLINLKQYKFLSSLTADPFSAPIADRLPGAQRLKSRAGYQQQLAPGAGPEPQLAAEQRHDMLHTYWESLKAILTDLEVTKDEVRSLDAMKKTLGLTREEIRALHARAFASMIGQAVEDRVLTDSECLSLKKLYKCLDRLGWAPGQ
jgi:DNA polymerase-3 subunit epsilon